MSTPCMDTTTPCNRDANAPKLSTASGCNSGRRQASCPIHARCSWSGQSLIKTLPRTHFRLICDVQRRCFAKCLDFAACCALDQSRDFYPEAPVSYDEQVDITGHAKEFRRRFYLSVYLFGWSAGPVNRPVPRWLRCALAKTETHRAWLSGYMGIYAGAGVCSRDSHHYRHRGIPERVTD